MTARMGCFLPLQQSAVLTNSMDGWALAHEFFHKDNANVTCHKQFLVQDPPCFSKVHFMQQHFCERPTLGPVWLMERNPKRIFTFKKGENTVQHLFYSSTQLRRGVPPSHFPELHSASKHQRCELGLWMSVLYLGLSWASVSKMCPKIIASSFAVCRFCLQRSPRMAVLSG